MSLLPSSYLIKPQPPSDKPLLLTTSLFRLISGSLHLLINTRAEDKVGKQSKMAPTPILFCLRPTFDGHNSVCPRSDKIPTGAAD